MNGLVTFVTEIVKLVFANIMDPRTIFNVVTFCTTQFETVLDVVKLHMDYVTVNLISLGKTT